MIQHIQINVPDIIPDSVNVLKHQGIPGNAVIPKHISSLLEEALHIFKSEAKPVSIIKEITSKEFDIIFKGERKNEDEAPLKNIYPNSSCLALFALTLGKDVSTKIEDLFKHKDFALGTMLDSVASTAAEKSVQILEDNLLKTLSEKNLSTNDDLVLGYSPGYCGWDISGQVKLFQNIKPENIGITLNDSYLMTPLKSVTGVLVHGDKDIHVFESSFSFCVYCIDKTCYERIEKLLNH
jgi:hypothetical protein